MYHYQNQKKKKKSKSQKQRFEWWLPGAEKRRKDSMLVKGTIFQLEDKSWGSNVQQDFPESARGKDSACQCKRLKRQGFDHKVGRIIWSRKWQAIPVFLPGTFHGLRSLAGYSSWGLKQLDMVQHAQYTTGWLPWTKVVYIRNLVREQMFNVITKKEMVIMWCDGSVCCVGDYL